MQHLVDSRLPLFFHCRVLGIVFAMFRHRISEQFSSTIEWSLSLIVLKRMILTHRPVNEVS
jgi:hypothetical protein